MQEFVITLRKQPSNSGSPSQPPQVLRTWRAEHHRCAAVHSAREHHSKSLAELSSALWDTANTVPRVWSCFGQAELCLRAGLKNRKGSDSVLPEFPFPLSFATLQNLADCSACMLSGCVMGDAWKDLKLPK